MAVPFLQAALDIVANVTGLWRSKDAQQNAADVKAAAEAAKDAEAIDQIRENIKNEDDDAIKQDITPSGGKP